ncbi:MAG TPA: L-threonylcarbamoyladenylate synthase [Xanthobacteraceae bacterium]|nr:L-threonylcarbamoyladenylate synthase [Xanthobacteraceae bacterium]
MATLRDASEPGAIEEAARILRRGGLVAFPTETVYGLGADATNAAAVAGIYAAKGRPAFNPLISHVGDTAAARALAQFDAAAETLAAAFWPGPLTIVLPKTPQCPVADLATSGLDTIAVRVPAHPVAHALIAALGRPVVAPSANRSGHVSPTSADHVMADLGDRIDLVLDGGATRVGVESTVLACLDGAVTLLRPGGVPRDAIERALGRPVREARVAVDEGEAPLGPGMLMSHYAPHATLRLNAADVRPGEALLAFGPDLPAGAAQATTLNLSARRDLIEAAANLFSHLRELDRAGIARIAVMPIPREGLGEAINDRLARAAAPRS